MSALTTGGATVFVAAGVGVGVGSGEVVMDSTGVSGSTK
ncbi:hypothetical protein J3D46_004465 [Paenarthrobacter sp. A20]|nr:hypothetical protein [Paenarthrobacter sp. A20]